MSMKISDSSILFLFGMLIGVLITCAFILFTPTNQAPIASDQWGGYVPMKIYTVFDRDTGVYYAVTEKGGICVMETMEGKTKLVDTGEGEVIHPNQGVSDVQSENSE